MNASTSIGDALYFSFMLDNIYRYYPEASIQLFCWHPLVSFYKSFPYLEQVIPYDRVEKDDKFALFLLRPKIDMFIDLQHTIDSAEIAQSVGAPIRIGVNPHRAMLDKYTHTILPLEGEHIHDAFYRGFSELWPEKDLDHELAVRVSDQHDKEAISLLLEHNVAPDDDFVLLHPGAKGMDKLWDNARWSVVAEALIELGFKVVLIGSCIKEWGGAPVLDEENCNAIAEKTDHKCANLVGRVDNFLVLSSIIKRARLYCGLDTGPTHLASLLNVSVIEIYKYVNEQTFALWRPYGEKARVIAHEDLLQVKARTVINEIGKELKTASRPETPSFSQLEKL